LLAASQWTSLEVVKVVLATLTPLVLFGLGIVVTRTARRIEDLQWANRTIVERRLEIYSELAPMLNDIFCFFMMVGDFHATSPPEVIQKKREADRTFFVNAPLFSRKFQERYTDFINTCFLQFSGIGRPALLRSSAAMQRAERNRQWDDQWDSLFSNRDESSSVEEVARAYDALMDAFALEVGVRVPERRPRPWLAT
jgi:hypothetical protein